MKHIHVVQSNGLGTASFVLGLVAFLTCGVLSPLALLFAMLAILKPPRGMAFAGLVLGALGSWWLFAGGLVMFLAIVSPPPKPPAAENGTEPPAVEQPADAPRHEEKSPLQVEIERLTAEAKTITPSSPEEQRQGVFWLTKLLEEHKRRSAENREDADKWLLEILKGRSLTDIGKD